MTDNKQWATPTPLRPDGTNLLPFPVNALPPIIGDMAQAIATTTSTDVAMAGTSILSAVSYCFSGMYRMSAKRDHTEPLVLDTLTIAEPSFKKSPVMSLIKRPYIQFAHDWNENNKQDIFTSQAERKLLQSKLEALEKKKDVTAEEIAKLQTELNKILSKLITNIRQNDLYKLCRCTLFKNAANFAETMDMLEEYRYIVRNTSKGVNNKTITDVIINPNIYR